MTISGPISGTGSLTVRQCGDGGSQRRQQLHGGTTVAAGTLVVTRSSAIAAAPPDGRRGWSLHFRSIIRRDSFGSWPLRRPRLPVRPIRRLRRLQPLALRAKNGGGGCHERRLVEPGRVRRQRPASRTITRPGGGGVADRAACGFAAPAIRPCLRFGRAFRGPNRRIVNALAAHPSLAIARGESWEGVGLVRAECKQFGQLRPAA